MPCIILKADGTERIPALERKPLAAYESLRTLALCVPRHMPVFRYEYGSAWDGTRQRDISVRWSRALLLPPRPGLGFRLHSCSRPAVTARLLLNPTGHSA